MELAAKRMTFVPHDLVGACIYLKPCYSREALWLFMALRAGTQPTKFVEHPDLPVSPDSVCQERTSYLRWCPWHEGVSLFV